MKLVHEVAFCAAHYCNGKTCTTRQEKETEEEASTQTWHDLFIAPFQRSPLATDALLVGRPFSLPLSLQAESPPPVS